MKRSFTYFYYLLKGKRRLYWQNKIDAIPLMEKMHGRFAGREIEGIEQVQREMADDIPERKAFYGRAPRGSRACQYACHRIR